MADQRFPIGCHPGMRFRISHRDEQRGLLQTARNIFLSQTSLMTENNLLQDF